MKNLLIVLGLLIALSNTGFSQCVTGTADPALTGVGFVGQGANCISGSSMYQIQWAINNNGNPLGVTTAPAGTWQLKVQFDLNGYIGVFSVADVITPGPFTWTYSQQFRRLIGTPNVDITYDPANPMQASGTVEILFSGAATLTCDNGEVNVTAEPINPNFPSACPQAFNDDIFNNGLDSPYGVSSALPVRWLVFKGEGRECKSVDLTWMTTDEINNKGFHVERSVNGSDFETIDFVPATESLSRSGNIYIYTDSKLSNNLKGMPVYYRLQQVDLDGRTEYSKIITVVPCSKAERSLAISPNPAINLINLAVTGIESENVDIQILNVNGQLVYDNELDVSDLISFDISKFESGVYTLRLEDGNHVLKEKFIKIR